MFYMKSRRMDIRNKEVTCYWSSEWQDLLPKDEELVRKKEFGQDVVVEQYSKGTVVQTTKEARIVKYKNGWTIQVHVNGVRVEVLPDGTKVQKNPNGSEITLKKDGSRVQKNVDGSTITISQNTVTQTLNDGETNITLRLDDGSKRVTSTRLEKSPLDGDDSSSFSSQGKETVVKPIKTLTVLSDGVNVQLNHEEQQKWFLVIKETDGAIVQQSRQEENILVVTKEKTQLFMPKALQQRTVILATKEESLEPMNANEYNKYKDRCNLARSQCNFGTASNQNEEFEKRLIKSEIALMSQAKEYERQYAQLKEKLQLEKTENKQHAENIVKLKKQLRRSTKKKPTKDASTQWCLGDAKTQFFQRQFTKDFRRDEQEAYSDPHLAAAIVKELRDHIMKLEQEKEEVEDRLIDLRFSIDDAKKRKTTIFRFLPILNFSNRKNGSGGNNGKNVSQSSGRAGLTREESLRKVLSEKRRKSLQLSQQSETMKCTLQKVQIERDEALRKCELLEQKLNAALTRNQPRSDDDIEAKEHEELGVIYENEDEDSDSDSEQQQQHSELLMKMGKYQEEEKKGYFDDDVEVDVDDDDEEEEEGKTVDDNDKTDDDDDEQETRDPSHRKSISTSTSYSSIGIMPCIEEEIHLHLDLTPVSISPML